MGELVGWARVSSVGQDLESQVQELEAAGCKKIYQGKHSGKAESNQAALDKMLAYIREGDTLVITKLDRLGRSLRQVLEVVDTLRAKGVTLKALHQPIDTSADDPMNNAMLQLMAMFAEMERGFIVERLNAGKVASGNYGGRKPALADTDIQVIKARLQAGESKSALAREFGVSRATVLRAARSV